MSIHEHCVKYKNDPETKLNNGTAHGHMMTSAGNGGAHRPRIWDAWEAETREI